MGTLGNSIHGEDADNHKPKVAVLLVPFPAQGHLNQLLQLSCIISSHGLPVFYIGSEIHNRQAKVRANGIDSKHVAAINFHDMPLPPFESPPPNPDSHDKFPSQLLPSWYASLSLREPFAAYLCSMSREYSRVVVIYDPAMAAVVQDVTSVENAEAYCFGCIPALFSVAFFQATLDNPIPEDFPKLPSLEGVFSDDIMNFMSIHLAHTDIRTGDLLNTSRVIEGPYLKILGTESMFKNKKMWAIGPIISMVSQFSSQHEALKWLDKQEPNSVIYASFGTTTSLSNEEIQEIASGLENSGVKFIWVLRDADKGDIFDGKVRRGELPSGFEERVKGVGLVIRDWAPQPEILNHPSTGGFMSHCGWNSCLESITAGVPIAAWPMHSDQPLNTALLTDVLKIGLIVRDWSRRGELVKAEEVEGAVRRLMASAEGTQLRNTAAQLGAEVRRATQAGGASAVDMESFIAHITR